MVQVQLHPGSSFPDWRTEARRLLASGVPPERVFWTEDVSPELLTPETLDSDSRLPELRVPSAFVSAASLVACARADDRWALLYRVLWRLVHGEPRLLDVAVDDDVRALTVLE